MDEARLTIDDLKIIEEGPNHGSTIGDPGVIKNDPKFTLFPKLAVEIRFMIWKLAVPGARLIMITSGYEQEYCIMDPRVSVLHPRLNEARIFVKTGWLFNASGAQVPLLLQVNQESRMAAKKMYKLSFEKELNGRQLWIDFDRDTIQFSSEKCLVTFYGIRYPYRNEPPRALQKSDVEQLPEATYIDKHLRNLRIFHSCMEEDAFVELLGRFQKLEELTVFIVRTELIQIYRIGWEKGHEKDLRETLLKRICQGPKDEKAKPERACPSVKLIVHHLL